MFILVTVNAHYCKYLRIWSLTSGWKIFIRKWMNWGSTWWFQYSSFSPCFHSIPWNSKLEEERFSFLPVLSEPWEILPTSQLFLLTPFLEECLPAFPQLPSPPTYTLGSLVTSALALMPMECSGAASTSSFPQICRSPTRFLSLSAPPASFPSSSGTAHACSASCCWIFEFWKF